MSAVLWFIKNTITTITTITTCYAAILYLLFKDHPFG